MIMNSHLYLRPNNYTEMRGGGVTCHVPTLLVHSMSWLRKKKHKHCLFLFGMGLGTGAGEYNAANGRRGGGKRDNFRPFGARN